MCVCVVLFSETKTKELKTGKYSLQTIRTSWKHKIIYTALGYFDISRCESQK